MHFDIAIIGGGVAGASLAAHLAPHRTVALIEAEPVFGYHATGRSAAFWTESYGGPAVRPLTTASGPWLAARGFLRQRGALHLARHGEVPLLDAFERRFAGQIELRPVDRAQLVGLVPGLGEQIVSGVLEPSCADIDVDALHSWYLARARAAGGAMLAGSRLEHLARSGNRWTLTLSTDALSADILVNAAGAWSDQVARLAGARPLGIQPYRRSVVQLAVAPPVPSDLPLVLGIAGDYYFKPQGDGRLWLSPHDESLDDARDVAADPDDVASAIERLATVVDWSLGSIERSWAGLRSFAPDRLPVYGFAPETPGFFWFAGQGGFGIQTAPAAAMIGAALLLGREPDPPVAEIDASAYAPDRLIV